MRQLFLSSSFKEVAYLFADFAVRDLKGKKVTFIPTAAKHEKVNMDDPNAAPELDTYDALNVIDFYPLPHQNCYPFIKTVEKIMSKYQATISLEPFSNSQAIQISGDNVKVTGQ